VFAAYNLFRKVPELAKLLSSITKGTNTLSLAETASKSLKLTGATIKNAADVVRGGADVYKYSHGLQNEKFVDLADKLSSTPEALQFGAGVVSIMAGGMQTISAGIDLKQVSKSRKHLNKAEQHLEARKQNDLSEQMYGELTEEQIRLKDLQRKEIGALIKHRQNMTTHTRNSALVDMTGGILSMLGGTMSVTGILAPLGGILSIAGSAISIGLGIIYARMARDKSIQEAVDEGLNLKKAVDDVIKYFNLGPITLEEYSELKNRVRQEALAELHYSGYKVCYLDMCMKSASLLYNKVVEKPSDQEMADYEQTDEYKMYYETLMSLGFEEIKRAEYPFQTSFPTAAQIYDRLTKGVT
jgi:hypothetical protein